MDIDIGSFDEGLVGTSTSSRSNALYIARDFPANATLPFSQKARITITYPPSTFQPPTYALKYGPQLRSIAWTDSFEAQYGIMDYTRHFIDDHGDRGVFVPRHTVEMLWAKAVKKRFEADKKKRRSYQ